MPASLRLQSELAERPSHIWSDARAVLSLQSAPAMSLDLDGPATSTAKVSRQLVLAWCGELPIHSPLKVLQGSSSDMGGASVVHRPTWLRLQFMVRLHGWIHSNGHRCTYEAQLTA